MGDADDETAPVPDAPEGDIPYWQRGRDEGGFRRTLFIMVIVILVGMVVVTSYGLARVNRAFGPKPAHLYFDAVDVKLGDNVTFDIYLTNDGETDSGRLEIVVHALKAGAGTQVIGGEASLKDQFVKKQTTQYFTVALSLPHDNYDVRIDVLEEGKMLLQRQLNLGV